MSTCDLMGENAVNLDSLTVKFKFLYILLPGSHKFVEIMGRGKKKILYYIFIKYGVCSDILGTLYSSY